ncbi:hypothetical protein [Cryobacterium sp. MLB-32]|uniref:hypothetical protein n=1 Tax=Cryobacterium sp. MLB-32 TaxID=1529318 RepID=UPI0012E08F5E|nr:hypothetical protein [Cryobacterium sp. MLB-32]
MTQLRFSGAGSVVVILVAVLTGCQSTGQGSAAPEPSPTSSSTSAPAETPAATDVDPLETVTVVEVGPESLDLVAPDGTTVMALSYDDAVDGVVAALTVVLGSEPTVTPGDGGLESPDYIQYEWPGFGLQDAQPKPGFFPDISNYMVGVTVSSQGDVSFVTPAGTRIGDDIRAEASERGVVVDETFASMDHLIYFEVGPELSSAPGENSSYPNAMAVTLSSNTPSGTIDKIVASSNPSFWVH